MDEICANAVAAGMEDAVFWGSTPAETKVRVRALAKRREAEERKANQRAGLIAAQIINMAGKVSRRRYSPDDFWKYDDDESDTPEALRDALLAWADQHPQVIVS